MLAPRLNGGFTTAMIGGDDQGGLIPVIGVGLDQPPRFAKKFIAALYRHEVVGIVARMGELI